MKHTQTAPKILLVLFMALFMVFGVNANSARAQETTDSARMAELIQRIQELQAQVKALQEQYAGLRTEIQEAMQLTRTLASGMSGEDVRALQELLATDAELYPEGLITGFYGPMTERAIERLQARFGIEQVGTVGPITQRTVNELFKNYRKEQKNMFKAVSVESDDDDDGDIDFSEFQPGVVNVLICHAPGGNLSKGKTIAVGGPAVQAHLAHGDKIGRCEDDDYDDEDESDDEDEDDDESDETTEGEAEEAIEDAEEAISEAQNAIDDAADNDLDVTVAKQLLEDAEELLSLAKEAFENEEYEEAEELADEAEDLADEAEEEAEDAE